MRHTHIARVLISTLLHGLVLLLSPRALGQVNVREGSYRYNPEHPILNAIGLRYSSRSSFRGRFGFGWCSRLDVRLHIFSGQIYQLNDCGRLVNVVPAMEPDKNRLTLRPPSEPDLTLTFDMQGNIMTVADGRQKTTLTFIRSDRITGALLKDSTGKETLLRFEEDSLDRHTIAGLRLPDSKFAFHYKNQNLQDIEVQGESPRWIFQYDSLHNLVAVTDKGARNTLARHLHYDHKDRVTEVLQGPCTETFNYVEAKEVNRIRSQKSCGGAVVYASTYELYYKPTSPRSPAQERTLDRYRVIQGHATTEITFSDSGAMKTFKVLR